MIVKLISHEGYTDELRFRFNNETRAMDFIVTALAHGPSDLEVVIVNKEEEKGEDA